jgi:hypothetical protein
MAFVFQQDPGSKNYRYYTITDTNNPRDVIGHVLVPNKTGTLNNVTYTAGTEYWFSVIALPSTTTSLTFTWQDYDWTDTGPTLGTLSFLMPQRAAWASNASGGSSGQPTSSATTFVSTSLNLGIGWNLTLSGSTWGGSLVWYNGTGKNDAFSGTSSGAALQANSRGSSGLVWYLATIIPTNPN